MDNTCSIHVPNAPLVFANEIAGAVRQKADRPRFLKTGRQRWKAITTTRWCPIPSNGSQRAIGAHPIHTVSIPVSDVEVPGTLVAHDVAQILEVGSHHAHASR